MNHRKAHLYTSARASFTIEAALVLPFFLLLMMMVLYLFEAGRLQMQIRDALYDAAILQARTAYLTQSDSEEADTAASSLLESGIQTAVSSLSIRDEIDSDLYDLIAGGSAGIICMEDPDNDDDSMTVLTAQCTVQLPIGIFGQYQFNLTETAAVHNWTGYEPENTEDSDMVYITADGSVYHVDRSCSYLDLTIRTVSADMLSSQRSSSGSRYYACEICGNETSSGIYYITSYGTAYHTSLSCSGLKRTIYVVSRDETSLPACSRCGGGS